LPLNSLFDSHCLRYKHSPVIENIGLQPFS